MTSTARTSAVFLRGVNVNGITVRSAPLRACLLAVPGIDAAATVLASGNAVVRTDLNDSALKTAVEDALRSAFGYDAWVVVLPLAQVEQLREACPYPDDDPAVHAYLTLCADAAAADALESAAAQVPGSTLVRLSPVALAWQAPVGASTDGPLAKIVARAAFRRTTTTRNARTLTRVIAAAATLTGR